MVNKGLRYHHRPGTMANTMDRLTDLPADTPHHVVRTPQDVAAAFAGSTAAVVLVGTPDAAAYQGVGWLRRVAAQTAPAGRRWSLILDCGNAPGLALEALEDGVPAVRVRTLHPDALRRLREIAAALGAVVLEDA